MSGGCASNLVGLKEVSASIGEEAANLSYQQQASFNIEMGRSLAALNKMERLDSLQREVNDLLTLETESRQETDIQQMALQERKLLEEQASL